MHVLETKRKVKNEIQPLNETNSISPKEFGVKAASLNNNPRLFNWIPKGFALSIDFVSKTAKNKLSFEELITLKNIFNELKNDSDNLILRSSSLLEWVNGHSFAGLFKTIGGIKTFDTFIDALKVAFIQANSDDIKKYATLQSVDLIDKHIAFLIQEEIEVISSALIVLDKDTDFIEIFKGDIKQAVRGAIPPSFIQLKRKEEILSQEGTLPNFDFNTLNELDLIIDSARQSLKVNQSIHLEIGFSKTNIYVLQVNELVNQTVDNFIVANRTSNFMTKSEAMKWFHKVGLFQYNLKIYLPTSKDYLYNKIVNDFDFKTPVTLRFSYKNQLNLPRGFFKNKEELNVWLKKSNISNKWKVIVHEYISVRRSFELLLDKDFLLLEHIPGMWESDNILNPDVIYSDFKKVKTWIWNKKRNNLKFADLDFSEKYQEVVSDDVLVEWQMKLSSVVKILRDTFKAKLPLNFHFVENDSKDWTFLNIRKGFDIIVPKESSNDNHIVSNLFDLEKWDGKKHLYLKISSQRDYEQKLLEIIKKLPKNTDKIIFVDFGLLSHPAMILREFGYNLVPSYFTKDIEEVSSNYTFKSFDVKDDPIKRIMLECPVYENDDFKVVHDRNPIVDNHLLVVSKHSFTSMADNDNLKEKYNLLFSELKQKKIITNFVLVERGRAKFCTSGFTSSHAHAHIIPTESINENVIDSFKTKINACSENDLDIVLDILRKSNNEYLLLINNLEIYFQILPENHAFEKQLIRNHFSNHLI